MYVLVKLKTIYFLDYVEFIVAELFNRTIAVICFESFSFTTTKNGLNHGRCDMSILVLSEQNRHNTILLRRQNKKEI